MQKIQLVIVLLFSTIVCFAQTHSSADRTFQSGNYTEALAAYGALLKNYPNHALYLYRYARCAQELGNDSIALEYFQKAGDRYMLKYFYMGDIYMRLWDADNAITSYTTYLNSLKEPNEREQYIQQQIAKAEKWQRYLRRVEKIQVIDSVEISLDSMLNICALSTEAGSLIMDTLQNLIYTNQRGDRKLWATKSDSTHVLVSSYRLLDEWTKPDTLPQNINFTQKQYAPYMLSDGITLYFAANDSNGLGGLDIYVSRYNMATENYTTPENIGMPYNSPANEYLFLLDETQQVGYLATDRFATKGRVHIYSFIIPQQKQYWRDIPTDSLVAYAKLVDFELCDTTNVSTEQPVEYNDEIKDFCFIINDSVIYHSIDNFQQPEAKEKYYEWKKTEKQYYSEQKHLKELRKQYAFANKTKQKELTPIILQLENNQSQLLKRCQNLLLEIRSIELKER